MRKIYLYFGYYFWTFVHFILSSAIGFIVLVVGTLLTTIHFVVKISESKHLPDNECVMLGIFFGILSLFIILFCLIGIIDYADHKSFEFEIKIEGTENDPTNQILLNL